MAPTLKFIKKAIKLVAQAMRPTPRIAVIGNGDIVYEHLDPLRNRLREIGQATARICLPRLLPLNSRWSVAGAFSKPCCTSSR